MLNQYVCSEMQYFTQNRFSFLDYCVFNGEMFSGAALSADMGVEPDEQDAGKMGKKPKKKNKKKKNAGATD